jgi:hypothetical protein
VSGRAQGWVLLVVAAVLVAVSVTLIVVLV